jgi:hypothetical protein
MRLALRDWKNPELINNQLLADVAARIRREELMKIAGYVILV